MIYAYIIVQSILVFGLVYLGLRHIRNLEREHKRERQELINQIMYQAGQTWTPPPARSEWTPPEPANYDWSPKPDDIYPEE